MKKHIALVLKKYPTAICRNYGEWCVLVPGIIGLSHSKTEAGAWLKAAQWVK